MILAIFYFCVIYHTLVFHLNIDETGNYFQQTNTLTNKVLIYFAFCLLTTVSQFCIVNYYTFNSWLEFRTQLQDLMSDCVNTEQQWNAQLRETKFIKQIRKLKKTAFD